MEMHKFTVSVSRNLRKIPFQFEFSKSQSTSSVSIGSYFHPKAHTFKNKSELIAHNKVLYLIEKQAILVGNHVHSNDEEKGLMCMACKM